MAVGIACLPHIHYMKTPKKLNAQTVAAFGRVMEQKLTENAHKGHWGTALPGTF